MQQEIHHISLKDIIRTRGSGKIDLPLSLHNLENVVAVWRQSPEQNILVDLRARTIEFTPKEINILVEAIIDAGLATHNRVALLYRHRTPFDHAKFLEFLAVGRGMSLRAFEDFEEALHWLGTSVVAAKA